MNDVPESYDVLVIAAALSTTLVDAPKQMPHKTTSSTEQESAAGISNLQVYPPAPIAPTCIAFVIREFGELEDLHRQYQVFLNADYGNASL